jgi:hypothetical protein
MDIPAEVVHIYGWNGINCGGEARPRPLGRTHSSERPAEVILRVSAILKISQRRARMQCAIQRAIQLVQWETVEVHDGLVPLASDNSGRCHCGLENELLFQATRPSTLVE